MVTHAMLSSRSLSVNDTSTRDATNQIVSLEQMGSVCNGSRINSSSSLAGFTGGDPNSFLPSQLPSFEQLSLTSSTSTSALAFPGKEETSASKLRSRSIGSIVPWQGTRMSKGTTPRKKLFYLTSRRSREKQRHQPLPTANCLQSQVVSSSSIAREKIDSISKDVIHDNSLNRRKDELLLNASLVQKYQPKSFQEIVGHKIIVKTLSSAVEKKKIAPLYLFHGPNGTGKTSTARIFSMALNCESNSHKKPCCSCKGCSRSLYAMELCSGSRLAGFENIKTLLQSTSFTQAIPGLKVLIVEECHSFTAEAWDELLSLVEGPYGSKLVFVLITADGNKVAGNIASRCQKFHFAKLKNEDITLKLAQILMHEDIQIEREALKLIVAKSEGSLRDAENIIDQLALLGSTITSSMVQQLVGLIPQDQLIDLIATAVSGDTMKTIRYVKELITVVEPLALVSQIVNLITDILSGTSVVDTSSSSTSTGHSEEKRLFSSTTQLAKIQSEKLFCALKILVETEKQLGSSTDHTSRIFAAFLEITSEDACSRMSTGIVLPRNVTVPSGHTTEPSTSIKGIGKTQRYIGKEVAEKNNLINMSDMEKLWKDVLERIESRRTKEFLWQQVKLASISISRTNAIVHLIFRRQEDKMVAQISEESLAKVLETAIGCPVTVNMSLDPLGTDLMEESTISSESQLLGSQHQRRTASSPRFADYKINKGPTSLITARESSPLSESLRIPKSKVCSTSQGQGRNPSKGHETTTDPERKALIKPQTATGTTQTMRVNKLKHRRLSLSSIPQNDASVEPYSQDVLYENAKNKDRENKMRKKLIFHKGFSKTIEDYHSHSTASQLQLSTSWSCIDICCSKNGED